VFSRSGYVLTSAAVQEDSQGQCRSRRAWLSEEDCPKEDEIMWMEAMRVMDTPFFWAFLATIGWAMGMLTVGSNTVGRYPLYGFIGSQFAQLPRIVLPLWCVTQPRFQPLAHWSVFAVGAVLCIVAAQFALPGLGFKIYTRPTKVEPLVTTGYYGIVRHPILFANIAWSLGWPIVWGSWVGLATFPVWFLMVFLMSCIEEERMVETYGDEYREYRKRVPRMIPFLKLT
jgi:protein-S-isoprenylcysteine O-methyltransferase Ste14